MKNEGKRDNKSKQGLQDDLGGPWGGRFSGYRAWARSHLEGQNRAEVIKNRMQKIIDFLSSLKEKTKKETKIRTHSKMEPNMVENRAHQEVQEENRKSVKTNNAIWFSLVFTVARGRKSKEKLISIGLKIDNT